MSEYRQNLLTRLWQKDPSLWSGSSSDTDSSADSIANRLGWLDAVAWMDEHIGALNSWVQQTVESGKFDTVILLGMGGSSLAAEVFAAMFDNQPASIQAYPQLRVVDTTSPAQINALDVNLERSLIIVASKSGSTVETADLFAYFHARLGKYTDHPGTHLVAITDPNSSLHQQAIEMEFTRIFLNPPNIGGRYSALSYFGLVPAALIGVNLDTLLTQTRAFSDRHQGDADNPANPVCQLAKLMGNGALSGRNILQLRLAPQLQSLAVWIEQLVAESLGKEGKGILPVYDDSSDDSWDGSCDAALPNYSDTQSSVSIGLGGLGKETQTKTDIAHMQWYLGDRYDIGGEFLRWEMATALAASIMDVNPFDQPDVEQAKQQTRLFITEQQAQPLSILFASQHYTLYANAIAHHPPPTTIQAVFDCFGELDADALYLAVLAYLPNFTAVNTRLQTLCRQLAQRFALTTTLGYGPRYLHSTGQLHKGGPASGCFMQITEQYMEEIKIPGKQYGFADLHRAQADGDYAVLEKKGLPLMRITLKGDRLWALDKLLADISLHG